jgi:hypothetical protein
MATSVEVSYVTQRRAEHPPHERIEGIGGIWNYKPWRMSEEYAIREVERTVYKQWDFCVSVAGLTLPLIVAEHKGRKYLTTAEGIDVLLDLPAMPRELVAECVK